MKAVPVPPVVKSILVKAPPARAFETFTLGMHRWWPAEHSLNSASPRQAIIVEPRPGGRWFERAVDGSECNWGHVIAWEPPHRVVFGWQLDATWKFDRQLFTEVEIRFEAKGQEATLVHLEHRNLERFGERAIETRKALDSENGWQLGLGRFTASFETPVA